MADRILVVAAHPDDELLGVGGTILRHIAAGDAVTVHIECSRGLRDGDRRIPIASSIARETGYELTFGQSWQLGGTPPDIAVESDGRGHQAPDIVYTHHPGDLNADHRLVAEAVRVACRPYTSEVRSLRYFDTASSTEWGDGFTPHLFVDIDPYLGEKVELLARYTTEMRPWPHPRSEQGIVNRARYWGSIAGFRAAEAFAIGRERW